MMKMFYKHKLVTKETNNISSCFINYSVNNVIINCHFYETKKRWIK